MTQQYRTEEKMTGSGKSTGEALSGKLLVAMPGMGDPRFQKSVIYMCAHSEEGAMGIIVNKPMPELTLGDLLEQLDIPRPPASEQIRVQMGGPVEPGRGFVLHTSEYATQGGTMRIDADYALTATRDILVDIARGAGPRRSLLALGYAGWSPGQLEGEIAANGWLVAEANDEILFDTNHASKWDKAIRSLGIDPRLLSSGGGMA